MGCVAAAVRVWLLPVKPAVHPSRFGAEEVEESGRGEEEEEVEAEVEVEEGPAAEEDSGVDDEAEEEAECARWVREGARPAAGHWTEDGRVAGRAGEDRG